MRDTGVLNYEYRAEFHDQQARRWRSQADRAESHGDTEAAIVMYRYAREEDEAAVRERATGAALAEQPPPPLVTKAQIGRNTFDMLQDTIGEWSDATFPGSTPMSWLDHLRREVAELSRAIAAADRADWIERRSPDGNRGAQEAWAAMARADAEPAVMEELADIAILSLAFSHRMRSSLCTAIVRKMGINRKRRWSPPDDSGVVEHDRAAEPVAR